MKKTYERHGMRRSKAYGIWTGIRNRCNNPNEPAYQNYGGRGISVCQEWSKFTKFYSDMGDPPPGMTLDRVDNDKGYSLENCQWRSRTEQGRNKRNNVLICLDGETHPLSFWAERFNIGYKVVHQRLRLGWSPNAAITTPVIKTRAGIGGGMKFPGRAVI